MDQKNKILNISAAMRFSPFHNMTYIANHKCGSTSIRYSLWHDYDLKNNVTTYQGRDYDIAQSPFLRGARQIRAYGVDNFAESHFFTVVRNPFSKVLSSYLHQVQRKSFLDRALKNLKGIRKGRPNSWQQVAQLTGKNPWLSVSFKDFLSLLSDIPTDKWPTHFRPQVDSVGWGDIPYDFIGKLENPDPLNDYFKKRDIVLQVRAPHSQNTLDKMQRYYGQAEIDLVRHLYRDDFNAFSYSRELDDVTAYQAVTMPKLSRNLLVDFMRSGDKAFTL